MNNKTLQATISKAQLEEYFIDCVWMDNPSEYTKSELCDILIENEEVEEALWYNWITI